MRFGFIAIACGCLLSSILVTAADAFVTCLGLDADAAFVEQCGQCITKLQSIPEFAEKLFRPDVKIGIRKGTESATGAPPKEAPRCLSRCLRAKPGKACKGCSRATVWWNPATPSRRCCQDPCATLAHELKHALDFNLGLEPTGSVDNPTCELSALSRFLLKVAGGFPEYNAEATRWENLYLAYYRSPICPCPRYSYDTCIVPNPLQRAEGSNPTQALQMRAECDPQLTNKRKCPWTCGNAQLNKDETCDDGNIVDGDGCNHLCKRELPDVCEAKCAYEDQICHCEVSGINGTVGVCRATLEGNLLVCTTDNRVFCFQKPKCQSTADCGVGEFCFPDARCNPNGGTCNGSWPCWSQNPAACSR